MECNFKIEQEKGVLNKRTVYKCGLTRSEWQFGITVMDCPGEENCIFFMRKQYH